MKKHYPAIILFLIVSVSFSCSNDDDESETLRNIEGTVRGISPCNTDLGDLAYEIVPSNFDDPPGIIIITATLPEEFKEEGLKIKFDMKQSAEHITTCTAIFYPAEFYEVFNVTLITEPGMNGA